MITNLPQREDFNRSIMHYSFTLLVGIILFPLSFFLFLCAKVRPPCYRPYSFRHSHLSVSALYLALSALALAPGVRVRLLPPKWNYDSPQTKLSRLKPPTHAHSRGPRWGQNVIHPSTSILYRMHICLWTYPKILWLLSEGQLQILREFCLIWRFVHAWNFTLKLSKLWPVLMNDYLLWFLLTTTLAHQFISGSL